MAWCEYGYESSSSIECFEFVDQVRKISARGARLHTGSGLYIYNCNRNEYQGYLLGGKGPAQLCNRRTLLLHLRNCPLVLVVGVDNAGSSCWLFHYMTISAFQ